MALTASRTTEGFEFLRYTTENEILYLPGNPGVTYLRGDRVALGLAAGAAGTVVLADGTLQEIGTVTQKVVCPANTVSFPLKGEFNRSLKNEKDKCLIPVKMDVPAGTPIYLCTFAGQSDETVADAGSNSSRYYGSTTGYGADNDGNGGVMYAHVGPNAGELNVQEDYDQTGGTVEKMVTFHRPFNTAVTTSSEIIVPEGQGTGAGGVGFLGRLDLSDENTLDVTDGQAAEGSLGDGDWTVFMSWPEAFGYVSELMFPVIRSSALYE